MSDSRITQARQKVRAAMDLVSEAGGLIDELLDEDPAFSEVVTDALKRANDRGYMAASQIMAQHAALRTADHVENRRSA